MRFLVSVRDVAEAREALRAGVDFIDLKEPAAGALGGLELPVIREVVAALRSGGGRTRRRALKPDAAVTITQEGLPARGRRRKPMPGGVRR